MVVSAGITKVPTLLIDHPDGFVNHSIGGEGGSSSPKPKISYMFCADAEIPVSCRQLINGGREPNFR